MKNFFLATVLSAPIMVFAQCIDPQTVTVSPSNHCGSGTSIVTVANSQAGFDYYLRDNVSQAVIDGPIAGGGSINFSTGNISTTTTYQVYGEASGAATALDFNGTNQLVNIANSGDFAFGTGDFTIEAWVNTSNAASANSIIGKLNAFWLSCDGSGVLFSAGSTDFHFITNNIADGNWHHVAGVRASGQLSLYIDGTLISGTTPSASNVTNSNSIHIGDWDGSLSAVMNGSIDEVRIWNDARTGTEIMNNMNECLTGSETGLVALYNMEDGTGSSTVTDIANGNNGTLNANMDPNTDWVSSGLTCACSGILPQTVTVTINSNPTLSDTPSDPSCAGDSDGSIDITAAGGDGSYTFDWAHITTGTEPEDLSGLSAGTYDLTVTDGNACSASIQVILNDPSAINVAVDAANDPSGCSVSDGAISITATGGTGSLTYDWSDGVSFSSTMEDISGLDAGAYTVTVTDDNGCTETGNATLSEPNGPTVTLNPASVLALDCNGDTNGSIDIDVTLNGGATSATYDWNSGTFSTEDIAGLAAGSYSVTVTDNNNCAASATYDVMEPTAITITGITTDATCNGDTDGAVDITVSDGTPGYTYDWNSGAFTTEDISSLGPNAYDVAVTDANGCTETASFTVSEPAAVTGTTSVMDITCNSLTDGTIDLTASGGNGTYTYLWDDAGSSTTEDLSGLGAGSYNVVITDGNGCTGNASATIAEPAALAASGTSTDEIMGMDGTIDLTVTGGTASFTYAWTGPNGYSSTLEDPTGLEAGSYDVTVTDANGCTTTAQVVVGSQVGVVDVDRITLNVFPNPSNGVFTVTSSINSGQLIVRDALGREVTVMNINGNRTDFDLQGNEYGIYFLELRHEDTVKTIRIVLQK